MTNQEIYEDILNHSEPERKEELLTNVIYLYREGFDIDSIMLSSDPEEDEELHRYVKNTALNT